MQRLKQTAWLPLTSGDVISPQNIIIFPVNQISENLERDLEKVFRDQKSSYAILTMLTGEVSHANVPEKVCSKWYENDVLKFLLEETAQPSTHCQLILTTLNILFERKQTIRKENLESLKKTSWLVDANGRAISPQKVIHFPSFKDGATTILMQVKPWDYVTSGMLREDIDISSYLAQPQLQELFVTDNFALRELGNAIEKLSKYYIGDFALSDFPLDRFLKVFDADDILLILGLAKIISQADFQVHILPKVLKAIDSECLVKIFQWIAKTYENPSKDAIAVYNMYLQLACRRPQNFGQKILPHIQLLNHAGKWKSPKELCDCDRYTGIDGEYLLGEDLRQILSSWLDSLPSSTIDIDSFAEKVSSSVDPNVKTNAQIIEEYFRPWLSYISSEAIGGFLCLLAGTDIEIQKLAKFYLHKRNFDDLRERFLWSQDLKDKNFEIFIKSRENTLKKVSNLCGSVFNAKILENKVPEHLFVGELNQNIQKITLVAIKIQESISNKLPEILLESTKLIIEKVHKTELIIESLNEIWQDLSTSKQLDVQFVKNSLLKYPPNLMMLGIQNPELKRQVQQWLDADMELDDLERRNSSYPKISRIISEVNDKRNNAKESLKILIETEEDVASSILEAVRKKIGQGHYGYDVSSIPFELFQNADDSLAELKKMLGNLPPERLCYVLAWDANRLTMMHFGW